MFSAALKKFTELNNALIIDDEIDICMLLKNFLIKKSREVMYSTTLKEGLEKFREANPDLLILDHNLPDGHGIDYISKFKESHRGNNVFIIVISAMSNLRNKALENGADLFMEKPISFSKLNEALMLKQIRKEPQK